MTTIRYKGFDIVAQPYQLHATGRWTIDLEIWRGGQKQHFSLKEDHRTEAEADARCAGVGRRIIDGGVRGYSVRHLQRRKWALLRWAAAAGIVLVSLAAVAGIAGWIWLDGATGWAEWIQAAGAF